LAPGAQKTSYISVVLDKVDLEENTDLAVLIQYGKDADFLLKNDQKILPFRVEQGINPVMIGGGVAVVLIIIILVVLVMRRGGGASKKSAPKKKKSKPKKRK